MPFARRHFTHRTTIPNQMTMPSSLALSLITGLVSPSQQSYRCAEECRFVCVIRVLIVSEVD
jgi:hypothetical protein